MVEIKINPSPRELRVFGLLWIGFFAAAGGVAWWKPEGLLAAAIFLGTAWLVSLIFNPAPRRDQLLGFALPLLFLLLASPLWLDRPRIWAATAAWAVGVLGALVIWAAPGVGRRIFIGWMYAALPVGWTVSQLILGIVFYLVLTPIGLIMRLGGYDPMRRGFERDAPSYWIERKPVASASRHFRQF